MILNPIDKEKIQGRARIFFRSKQWKNFLVFFTFVVLASVFWALQYFRQKNEFEVPISIHYTHIPPEVVLSNNLPQKITLHVQDKGGAWLNYSVNSLLAIDINLKNISLHKTSYVVEQSVLYSLICENLLPTTQLKSFFPEQIEINYALLSKKELPVVMHGTILPAPGHMFSDSIRIEPANVIAYGDKTSLDTLREISTSLLNYKNISKNWAISAQLKAPEGIRLSVEQVRLSAEVEEYTEKNFELPILCDNVPSNRMVRFFPSTVDVFVQVGLSKYAQISSSNFEIKVDYNELIERNATSCSLKLTRKPVGIGNYRIVPEVIEFLVERKSIL